MTDRAAVLIGVDRTGGLPVLNDAAKSARRMAAWARSQSVDHVVLITDEERRSVGSAEIKGAIRDLTELGTVERLVVFFAGHGINVNRTERWLLSDAPEDPQAAVNVPGSADLARWGRIPYVAMISDACRTAAGSIQTQGLTGSEIFPNEEITDSEWPVDQFFACGLGRPSHEIADPNVTTKEYKAIYTGALVAALSGSDPTVLDAQGYVRPRPLKRFLREEVARLLRDTRLETKLVQVPDAHIASDETAWLSRIDGGLGAAIGSGNGGHGDRRAAPGGSAGAPGLIETASSILASLLIPLLYGSLGDFDERLRASTSSEHERIADVASSVEEVLLEPAPRFDDAQCGFEVRGARIREVVAAGAGVEQFSDELVRISAPEREPSARNATNVLLVFENGLGVALPAIPSFLTTVTVEGGEVLDIAYEPSRGSWRWDDFAEHEDEVRALRAVAASFSREGVFELESEEAVAVARRMQYAKGVDPSLALYAAYAYVDQGRRDLVREMHRYMVRDLGAALFDLALLAREPERLRPPHEGEPLGFAPLLAQGWALLPASRMTLPPSLEGLEREVLPGSLWTTYDRRGVERIRRAISAGELR